MSIAIRTQIHNEQTSDGDATRKRKTRNKVEVVAQSGNEEHRKMIEKKVQLNETIHWYEPLKYECESMLTNWKAV